MDTLKLSEDLKASGFTDSQAKGITEAFKEVHEIKVEGLATKEDFAKLEGKLNERTTKLEGSLNERITKLESKMTLFFVIIVFVILFTNPKAIDLVANLPGLIK